MPPDSIFRDKIFMFCLLGAIFCFGAIAFDAFIWDGLLK